MLMNLIGFRQEKRKLANVHPHTRASTRTMRMAECVYARAQTVNRHARTRICTHYTRPRRWTDGLGASARTHMHTHSQSLQTKHIRTLTNTPSARTLNTFGPPQTPHLRPPVRQASPPPPKRPPHWSKGARTYARSPLIRPPAISPANLPHARLPAAPPVSRQDVWPPPRLGHRQPHALPPPCPCLTAVTRAPVHVELAPRRGEAVTESGRGRGAVAGSGEVCPGPGGGIVHVQVVEVACTGRTGSHRLHAGRAARMRTHAWLSAAAACTAAKQYL
jgi:hypothetical protein